MRFLAGARVAVDVVVEYLGHQGEAVMGRSGSGDTKPKPGMMERFLDREECFFRGAVWALVLSLPVWIGLALLFGL